MSKINIPTLIVNGGSKDIVPIDEANYLNNNIKNSELLILEKYGHCRYISNCDEFYKKVFDFFV